MHTLAALLVAAAQPPSIRIPVTKVYSAAPRHGLELAADPVSIPLFNKGNTMYLCPVTVGSSQQAFMMTADTGSSNVWMMAAKCDDCDKGVTHHKYNASLSTSYRDLQVHVSLRYGTGSALGDLFQDTLAVGNVTVVQKMASMAHVTEPFPTAPIEGLLGLAFDGIAQPAGEDSPPPFLYTLQASGALERVVFHFDMTSDGRTGELVFGEMPRDLQSGVVNWLPVQKIKTDKFAFWMVEMDGYRVGPNTTERRQRAAVDSGTSYIIMPQDAWDALQAQMPKNLPPADLCSGRGLPALVIVLGGVHYELSGADYVVPAEDGPGCALALSPAPAGTLGEIDWLLGDTFHRKFSVAYDFDEARVGLPGKRANVPEPHVPTDGVPLAWVLAALAVCAALSGALGLRVGRFLQKRRVRTLAPDLEVSLQTQ